jgi:hypothetical protein
MLRELIPIVTSIRMKMVLRRRRNSAASTVYKVTVVGLYVLTAMLIKF